MKTGLQQILDEIENIKVRGLSEDEVASRLYSYIMASSDELLRNERFNICEFSKFPAVGIPNETLFKMYDDIFANDSRTEVHEITHAIANYIGITVDSNKRVDAEDIMLILLHRLTNQ